MKDFLAAAGAAAAGPAAQPSAASDDEAVKSADGQLAALGTWYRHGLLLRVVWEGSQATVLEAAATVAAASPGGVDELLGRLQTWASQDLLSSSVKDAFGSRIADE